MYAQAKGIGLDTNIEAQATTIQETLKISYRKRFQNLLIETDSLSLKNIIQMTQRIPWEIGEIMEDIMKEMRTQKAKIKHISREGNPIADYLANLAINQTDIQEFNEFAELPIADKHIINLDKTQISSIRIRTWQIIYNVRHIDKQGRGASKQFT
ncbi:hypothetical protein RDI58_010872 [Solanum bulbocastanum]|uniref:RNase H type-1 domain-containing protein n=1 Tax=Solanum bulbocastanum TaxID=147425 RepID=A0AAN8TUF9_SOLBU